MLHFSRKQSSLPSMVVMSLVIPCHYLSSRLLPCITFPPNPTSGRSDKKRTQQLVALTKMNLPQNHDCVPRHNSTQNMTCRIFVCCFTNLAYGEPSCYSGNSMTYLPSCHHNNLSYIFIWASSDRKHRKHSQSYSLHKMFWYIYRGLF